MDRNGLFDSSQGLGELVVELVGSCKLVILAGYPTRPLTVLNCQVLNAFFDAFRRLRDLLVNQEREVKLSVNDRKLFSVLHLCLVIVILSLNL